MEACVKNRSGFVTSPCRSVCIWSSKKGKNQWLEDARITAGSQDNGRSIRTMLLFVYLRMNPSVHNNSVETMNMQNENFGSLIRLLLAASWNGTIGCSEDLLVGNNMASISASSLFVAQKASPCCQTPSPGRCAGMARRDHCLAVAAAFLRSLC